MITGAAQMDGAILVVLRRRRPHAPDPRAHPAVRQVGVPYIIVFLNKATWSTTPNCSNSSKWKCANCSSKYDFPGDDTPSSRAAPSWPGRRRGRTGRTSHPETWDALDSYIPTPERAVDGAFLMPVEDVFSISGRGTVVTGRDRARHHQGWRRNRNRRHQAHHQNHLHRRGNVPQAAWTRVRLATTSASCCAARRREEVERGQVLCKPGSIKPHTQFTAEVYVLSKDEGGRHTPFFNNYRPQFYFRTTDVTGSIELPEGHGNGDAWRQREHHAEADRP